MRALEKKNVGLAWVAIFLLIVGYAISQQLPNLWDDDQSKEFYVEEYERAKADGDATALCYFARMQAKVELDRPSIEDYEIWKARQAEACLAARRLEVTP